MDEHGEDKFKRFVEIYRSGLRLVGAANATGLLAAGAAYQAFEKRPEAQSSIKVVIGLFFGGVIAFTLSQMAMFLAQTYMDRYFRCQSKSTAWETTLLAGPGKPTTPTDDLRMARYDFIVMSFSGLFSLVLFLVGIWFVGMFLIAL